ncbi:MAG: NUDIX hydrolase [Alphaproteobacteria bacterium]|jgi:ADP-ribose pyrophosphatase YjhB (NUDIX family)|nr:NUDIX hydrolase [Alphaproteobacteria bacterium]
MPKAASALEQIELLTETEPKHVKIVVFDGQNRVLAVKSGNRFVLPGGRIEWDDDDTEAAARREVFEAANIALGPMRPVTVIKTKDHDGQTAQTIVFVGRMADEGAACPGQRQAHRFMSKETFFRTSGRQGDLIRSLIDAAHRVLISEEIKDEHDETTLCGREKYNSRSLL